MQRIVNVAFLGLVSGLVLTGCPEKGAEKEAPAATPEEPGASDQAGAEDEKKDEKAEKDEEKKDEAAEEGGW